MTWTRWTLSGRGSQPDAPSAETAEGQPNANLPTALVLGTAAALLLALGSAVPVVDGASPGYSSTALLIVLSVLPMVLVAIFLLRGRPITAIGVLAGAAALAPGRAILDLQFVADPSLAARPELYRTEVFAVPSPAMGLWLLLAGHVATIAAGVVAFRALGPRSDPDTLGFGSGTGARGLLLAGTFAAAVAAVGVMMEPFSTNDAFLPVGSAFESPPLVLAGCLVLAFGLVVGAGLATSSGTTAIATGGLLGLAATALAIAVPNLVSGLADAGVSMAAGPVVMLVGVAGLLVVAYATTRGTDTVSAGPGAQANARDRPDAADRAATRDRAAASDRPDAAGRTGVDAGNGTDTRTGAGDRAGTGGWTNAADRAGTGGWTGAGDRAGTAGWTNAADQANAADWANAANAADWANARDSADAGEARLPGLNRLLTATGVLAVLTAAASLAGALTAQVDIAEGVPGPGSPSRYVLLVAGLLVGVLGVAMFVPAVAGKVRPALSVCWAGVPLAGTAVMTTAITASELGAVGLSPGPGVLWTALAVVGAVATACCSVVAGMVERDTADIAEGDRPGPNVITPLVAGGILAVGGFGTPSILAPDYSEPALWSNFGTPSWGLLIALLTVLGACVLAPRCRPLQATALLAGTTVVAALRVLQLPLTAGISGVHAGVGWWLALGCAVALLIATVLAPRTVAAGR